MYNSSQIIAVLGAGSWGTALAILLTRNGLQVRLWGLKHEIKALLRDKENYRYLPGISLPKNLELEVSLEKAIKGAHDILVVVPSHAFRTLLKQLAKLNPSLPSLSWATKGVDPKSCLPLSTVVKELFPFADLAVISGPTFAIEVAKGLPTAITIAASSSIYAEHVATTMRSKVFRPYTSNDIIGVQIGGATKNVIAIAAGISDGLGFGANSRAALITRGLAEINRFGQALGGCAETFMGLTGLGDLILTCTDNKSRNRRLGLAIASGKSLEKAYKEIKQEVEGISATNNIYKKAKEIGIEMPITEEVYNILFKQLNPKQAVHDLFHRKLRSE